jgi:hypothetical protein
MMVVIVIIAIPPRYNDHTGPISVIIAIVSAIKAVVMMMVVMMVLEELSRLDIFVR